jgi:hypothetical protein
MTDLRRIIGLCGSVLSSLRTESLGDAIRSAYSVDRDHDVHHA